MSALRVFLAVRPGEEVTRTLGTLQRRLQRMGVRCRWTSQDHMHLTLLFLGEVPGEAVETLAALVPPVAGLHAAFDMRLSGLGAFPGLRHAHVLWAGVARGTAELIALQTDLDRALTEAGLYAGDRFDFRPHVTLGRLPRPANLAALAEPYADWDGGVCPVDCVAVMASDLSQGRPRYTELCRAPLGTPPAD